MLVIRKNREYLPGYFYICATLAHLLAHECIKEAPLFLDETPLWFRRLGDLKHRHDALHFLCDLSDGCGRARAASRLLWRAHRHHLGCSERSDRRNHQRPPAHALGQKASVFGLVCHSVWSEFCHALVRAGLEEPDCLTDLRDPLLYDRGHLAD